MADSTIVVSPLLKSFGITYKDVVTDQTVTVSNTGTEALMVGALSGLSAPFSLVNDNVSDSTIYASDSSTVVVRFTPTALGDFSDTLDIPSSDAATPSYAFNVDGTAQQSVISVSPEYKSFGINIKDSTSSQVITVTNNGNVNLILGTIGSPSVPFWTNGYISDATIAPAGSVDMTAFYIPTALSTGSSSSITIPSNDPVTPTYTLTLDGTCQQAILAVTPGSKSFGVGIMNAVVDQTVSVSNSGNIDMTMGTLSGLAVPFSLVGDTVSGATIAADGTNTVVVRYDATALGTYSDVLDMSSSDPRTLTYGFNVDGTCEQPIVSVSPSSKAFGNVANLVTVDQTVTVSNTGNINLVMGTLSGLAAPYTMVNNNVTDATITPAGSQTVVVRYHPTVIGTTTDALLIPSNDTTTPTFSFPVSGTSQEADISVSPASKNFGSVILGNSSTALVTVTNIGNINLVMHAVTGLSSPFSVINDTVTDATIAPSGTKTLSIVFTPTSIGSYSGTLVFNSTDPDTAAYSFNVNGDCGGKTPLFQTGRTVVGINVYDFIKGQIFPTQP